METSSKRPVIVQEVGNTVGHAIGVVLFMFFFTILFGGLVAPVFLGQILRRAEKLTEDDVVKAREQGTYTENFHKRKRREWRVMAYFTIVLWFGISWALIIFAYYPYLRNGF